jgi:hypothetical protein
MFWRQSEHDALTFRISYSYRHLLQQATAAMLAGTPAARIALCRSAFTRAYRSSCIVLVRALLQAWLQYFHGRPWMRGWVNSLPHQPHCFLMGSVIPLFS